MKKIIILVFTVVFVSCKTAYVNKQSQKIASSALELATIGEVKPNLQINNFEVNAIPQLNEKIRVTATTVPFNNTTFKAYTKAVNLQGKKSNIVYIDSLPTKPTFVIFKLADKVTLLNELNSEANSIVFNYLKTVSKAKVITSVSMVFNNTILNEINEAEELYLSNTKYKKYVLELYKNKQLFKTIELTRGTTFTYKLAAFCWVENNKHKAILGNLIDSNSKCSKNTYNSYQAIEQKKYKIKL